MLPKFNSLYIGGFHRHSLVTNEIAFKLKRVIYNWVYFVMTSNTLDN